MPNSEQSVPLKYTTEFPTFWMGSIELQTPFQIQKDPHCLLPILRSEAIHEFELSPAHLSELQSELSRDLDGDARFALSKICTWFIASAVYREQIPYLDGYMRKLAANVDVTAKRLHKMLGTAYLNPPEFKNRPFYEVRDHMASLIHAEFPQHMKHCYQLIYGLISLEEELRGFIEKRAGAPGHYQLETVYSNLVRIAYAAGDNLEITSHSARELYAEETTFTPLTRFVSAFFRILLEERDNFLALYPLSLEGRQVTGRFIEQTLSRKSPANLAEPLEKARRILSNSTWAENYVRK